MQSSEMTWDSYGRKAMFISFNVFMYLAHGDLQSSLKSSSGHDSVKNTCAALYKAIRELKKSCWSKRTDCNTKENLFKQIKKSN